MNKENGEETNEKEVYRHSGCRNLAFFIRIGTGAVLANDMKKVLGGNFNAGIISNFTLLNDEIVRYLVENNIGCGISLDGTITLRLISTVILHLKK